MDPPDKTFSELVKSWIPWRSEPTNVSRDFWMPDHSCRVCYECDSQFTIFNRRHHCRLCGRVFCARCTSNSVPNSSGDQNTAREECERIRACNYCYKQWLQGVGTIENVNQPPTLDLSTSPSAASLSSTKSSGTINSGSVNLGLMPYSGEPYQHAPYSSSVSTHQSLLMETTPDNQGSVASGRSNDPTQDAGVSSPNQFGFCMNRSDDDEDDEAYQSDTGSRCYPQVMDFYGPVDYDMIHNDFASRELIHDVENVESKSVSDSSLHNSFDSKLEDIHRHEKTDEHNIGDEGTTCPSYTAENVDAEPVDFENNGLLWLPPEPEDEEDEKEATIIDDDDDGGGDATGEWGYLRTSSSFGSGEYRNRDRSSEEHKSAMKSVVDGHFRALVSQLLQVENVPVGEQDDKEGWLEIITSLSWEAATLLKPDTSKSGGMDPGGYVKIKCIASGRRCESMVVKGVVCKKNVAHRRMTSKIEKPRLLILGGALEYQRVSNLLSSFDTLLQQEMDHLKMAVAKIDAHHPDILLVEKSVSRFAQDYLLAKDISLVLNIKRPLLERIARCTGAQIIPSIDNLSSQKLGYCDMFHVERFLEDHGTAGQNGRKSVKTLMYFEDCPKPLGYTILLRGANGDELKKVKHVIQYGVFAAYHLALETSFLADEGASLPELPLISPLTVALPDKPSSIDKSISTIPGFSMFANEKPQDSEPNYKSQISNIVPSSIRESSVQKLAMSPSPYLPNGHGSSPQYSQPTSTFSLSPPPAQVVLDSYHPRPISEDINMLLSNNSSQIITSAFNNISITSDHITDNGVSSSEVMGHIVSENAPYGAFLLNERDSETSSSQQDMKSLHEPGAAKEEFPVAPSDHQSILVSLSSRCVWLGTVCERSHLFRIKYYGSFDKPLGRFLRDHLFDQSYRCRSCDRPSEAHVYCYTHRQGTLTISVKKLSEFLLPGEREGKIWMWHRCLRCPRSNGFPPATRRVIMSDAAWGLSFGKFLELSFSNHAAASRVASCGHSLHRDCLRFYGFGKMVACFRYASIDVNSVYLPPAKVDFNYESQEWIHKETNEVIDRAELLFSEVLNALSLISEKIAGTGQLNTGLRPPDYKRQIVEWEGMLQKEKIEFEESLQRIMSREVKKGQLTIDILEINRLRRQLIFLSYMWDRRLIYAASLDYNLHDKLDVAATGYEENLVVNNVMLIDTKGPIDPSNSLLLDADLCQISNHEAEVGDVVLPGIGMSQDKSIVEDYQGNHSCRASELAEHIDTRLNIPRVLSEGQFPIMTSLSDTLDAAWTGENHPGSDSAMPDSLTSVSMAESLAMDDHVEDRDGNKVARSPSPVLSDSILDNMDDPVIWLRMPFFTFYRSLNKNLFGIVQKLGSLGEYSPAYISSFRDLKLQGGRLLLPVGVNETVVPVYDDEPTSIISYALVSPDYYLQISDDGERPKDNLESAVSMPLFDSLNFQSMSSLDGTASFGSTDDSFLSLSGSRSSLISDPLSYTKALHARISFIDDGPHGKVKYTVTCYYAKRFDALRRICCPSEVDFIRSLSRCKKWGAQGGKSNVFFAKSLDDRFIIKQVTKTELESFIKCAPEYFKYLSESIGTGSPTCLAKILGIYQVTTKHLKGGKETRMDVLVMENLLFGRNITRLYDLKGSSRSRYNADSSGSNKVLLDQNLIEAMPTSPIFVGNKAKRLLERAVWNDTSFLASVDVMDYSLLVGVDEEKHELVLGIIDFVRQYTWDKHLETWVKASGILGGPKNSTPTVISPMQYKKRFRKAMTTYFLMLPDQWSPPTIIPSQSQSDLGEENTQEGSLAE